MNRILGILVMTALPLAAEGGSHRIVQTSSTQQVAFQPGGTIHLNRSFGYLSVEGWDRPEVEITVIKTWKNLANAQEKAAAEKRLERVTVTAEKKSEAELEISTAVPKHSRLTHPFGSTGGAELEYQIHAPRNSKLMIHHGTGDIIVTNIGADIEATGHAGDIVLLLPSTGQYSIDARSKLGTITSDFSGNPQRRRWVGTRYAVTGQTPARRIYLRMGVGGITIKESSPVAEPAVPADSK